MTLDFRKKTNNLLRKLQGKPSIQETQIIEKYLETARCYSIFLEPSISLNHLKHMLDKLEDWTICQSVKLDHPFLKDRVAAIFSRIDRMKKILRIVDENDRESVALYSDITQELETLKSKLGQYFSEMEKAIQK